MDLQIKLFSQTHILGLQKLNKTAPGNCGCAEKKADRAVIYRILGAASYLQSIKPYLDVFDGLCGIVVKFWSKSSLAGGKVGHLEN